MRQAPLLLFVIAIGIAGMSGCGESPPPASPGGLPAIRRPKPPTPPATASPSAVPDLPGEEKPETGMEILVRNPRLDRSADENAYQRDAKLPSGKLIGACKWAGTPARRKAPPPKPIDLAGPDAIKSPEKGEAEYYKNLRLTEQSYIADKYPGTYPRGVVVMLRGIRTGPREMFPRATFMVREGHFRPHEQFASIHERVMFGTYDSHPTHLHMRGLASGQVALDKLLTAFDRDTIKPLPGGGVHYTVKPAMLQSDVIHELGIWKVTCKRHPWKTAYAIIVDNPYGAISDHESFTIENIPVGRWQMDVWHPAFKPVKESLEVEIRKDETTEVAVEFHPPECLKSDQ